MARIALAILLLLAPATPARSQRLPDPYTRQLLDQWVTAVKNHVPGALDQPVAAIAAWDRDALLRVQPLVRTWVELLGERWRARPMKGAPLTEVERAEIRRLATAPDQLRANDFIKRAALLHTDVVLLTQRVPGAVPPPKPRSQMSVLEREEAVPLVIARGPDGRFSSFELGNLNWDYARDLLDAVTPAPEADDTVALWYRTIGAMFASSYSFGEAWPHIQRARVLFPNDAGILFGDAAVQETLASPRIQDYVRVTKLPNGQRFLFVESESYHLQVATGLLKRALYLDPSHAEARLRLGRVLSLMGRHAEALAELQAVPPQQDAVLEFYTHLVRGDVERAMAHYDAAERSYQQALDLFPAAQSARMALGHLARQRSDRDAALALLQPALTAPLPRNDDPWWDYFRGDGRNSETLFRRLRAPFFVAAPQ
jgi:hypothetical protein